MRQIMAQQALPPGVDPPCIADLDTGRAALFAAAWAASDGSPIAEEMVSQGWGGMGL